MDHFHHRDGELWCEDVPLAALAAEVGTPAYVYSSATVRDHVQGIQQAFAAFTPLICYAVKANANLALLARLRDLGCGFDIVSVGELRRLQAIDADPKTVVFSGVGKTRDEMSAALDWGVLLFNIESEAELDVLAQVATPERPAAVALRVNPDVDPNTHRYISTGQKESKFGVDLERGEALARHALSLPSIRLCGLQCHIGSQITTVDPYAQAVRRTADLAMRLRAEAPDLAWLNMGGGYGIYYDSPDVPSFADYAEAVTPALADCGLQLIMEPGRVIVGNAGVMLTRVLYNKRGGERHFVVVDAGMNDLLRPSLYGGYHRIWPVRGAPPPPLGTQPDLPPVDIVGPVCESGDFFAKDRPLPPVAPNDLVAVMSVGAYAFTMASNYNARPRPPEVLVDGDTYSVVRKRETLEDLWRDEDLDAPARKLGEQPA